MAIWWVQVFCDFVHFQETKQGGMSSIIKCCIPRQVKMKSSKTNDDISLVNTDCQEEEETVDLEMTGLANSSNVTVSENSFISDEKTYLKSNITKMFLLNADLIFSIIITRRLRKQLRLSFLARPTQPSCLRWKQMCTLLRFVTCHIMSHLII